MHPINTPTTTPPPSPITGRNPSYQPPINTSYSPPPPTTPPPPPITPLPLLRPHPLPQAELAACTDKKLLKDFEAKLAAVKENSTINFDRILVGKMETRSFPMTNTCLLPVAFEGE